MNVAFRIWQLIVTIWMVALGFVFIPVFKDKVDRLEKRIQRLEQQVEKLNVNRPPDF